MLECFMECLLFFILMYVSEHSECRYIFLHGTWFFVCKYLPTAMSVILAYKKILNRLNHKLINFFTGILLKVFQSEMNLKCIT